MKKECVAALAAMMLAAVPLAAQNPKATPVPLPMATSVSLDVRQVASRKQVNDAFDSRGVGSYDKTFSRERLIEIAVAPLPRLSRKSLSGLGLSGKAPFPRPTPVASCGKRNAG